MTAPSRPGYHLPMPVLADVSSLPVVRSSDLVCIARAAHDSVDGAHIEVGAPGRITVEPFAFYDEALPPEALAAVHEALRLGMPEWLLVEVRSAWWHQPAREAL